VGRGAELSAARDRLAATLGAAAVVDAAGVFAAFQRMDRLADATGLRAEALDAADLGTR